MTHKVAVAAIVVVAFLVTLVIIQVVSDLLA